MEKEEREIVKYFTDEKVSEITDRWQQDGLLDLLSDEQKNNIAICFEIAYLIFKFDMSDRFRDTYQLSFPVIRRIIQIEENKIPTITLISKTISVLEKLRESLQEQNKPWSVDRLNSMFISGVDAEAEFVAVFCEYYIEWYDRVKEIYN